MTRNDKTRTETVLPIDRRNALKMAGAGAMALGVISLANPATTWAQDLSDGADNFYVSDSVTVQPITFQTQYRTTVAGNLFIPNDLDRSVDTPAIVVGHPMGAVKEQSANFTRPRWPSKVL